MKIVITHINPDFDAVASAYAVYKLYNCDHIAVCTNMENNVYNFIKDSGFNINIKQYNDKLLNELDSIDTLIITDCNQRQRLGRLAALIDIAKEVIIFDHHAGISCDISADKSNILEIGATTSILCLKMQEKGITLSSLEATLLALGIYEDTGLFTFSKTTANDALALSYLLSQKADTTAANDYVQRELSNIQVMLLNELLLNLSIITVGGVDVAYSCATVDEYVDEAAFIAHKLMIIEGLSSLFILLSTGGRLVLIGRSNDSRVNVLSIVSQFGGGGHSVAGSAIIKDKMISSYLYILPEQSHIFVPKYDKDSCLISSKVAKSINAKEGDIISFIYNGKSYEVVITNIIDISFSQGIFISRARNLLDLDYTNAWIRTIDNTKNEQTLKELEENSDIYFGQTINELKEVAEEKLSSVRIMTNTIKIFAILLAIVVLYNLALLNFKERIKDIATLKVLGFNNKEIAGSFLLEILILTIISSILGLFLGYPLMYGVLVINENPLLSYIYHINIDSYLITLLLTGGFGVLINLLMSTFINKVKMVESLKAVD